MYISIVCKYHFLSAAIWSVYIASLYICSRRGDRDLDDEDLFDRICLVLAIYMNVFASWHQHIYHIEHIYIVASRKFIVCKCLNILFVFRFSLLHQFHKRFTISSVSIYVRRCIFGLAINQCVGFVYCVCFALINLRLANFKFWVILIVTYDCVDICYCIVGRVNKSSFFLNRK